MNSEWIWINNYLSAKPEMVYFKKKVTANEIKKPCSINIYADSRYVLMINGKRVSAGTCRAPKGVWYYDTVDITKYICLGENEIFVKVIRYTNDKQKDICFQSGPASVTTEGLGGLKIEETDTDYGFSTSDEYKCIEVKGYMFPENQVFGYLSFTENFDSRIVNEDTDDSLWKNAVVLFKAPVRGIGALRDFWYAEQREIPLPYEKEGTFIKTLRNTFSCSSGQMFVNDGSEAIIELDAGKLINAYPRLKFKCGEGSALKITYAEGYGNINENGVLIRGVRGNPEGQGIYGFSDIYTAREGTQTYIPFLYRCFRVIKIEVSALGGVPFILEQIDYIKTGYPLEISGSFNADDKKFEKIWDISRRTLACCMYETYMDCPYYEQMQYIMDTFLEIQYTFSISSDYRLARKAIKDFAESQQSDGMMLCNSPARFRQIIPGFPFYWILMLHSYMMYAGDREFIRRYLGTLDKLLQFYEIRINADNLLGDTGYWQFFDWVKEWECGVPVKDGEVNILYNMLYIYGLRKAGEINRFCGRFSTADEYAQLADKIAKAVREKAFDIETGLFSNAPGEKPSSQHAQIFAVLSSVVSEEEKRPLIERMLARIGELSKPSYCFTYFQCRALEETGLYAEVHKQIKLWDMYSDLMKLDLTTWPEDFVTMRSDCHGWSAVPLYEFAACFLGVKPLAPGYSKVGIIPQPVPLDSYGGKVPIGNGKVVEVSIAKDERGHYNVTVIVPESIEYITDFSKLEN